MMIEFGRKRMLVAISLLTLVSVLIIILESTQLQSHQSRDGSVAEDIHELHPDLKKHLKKEDKCWQYEKFEILEVCDVCTDNKTDHIVCVAEGKKEKVQCESGKIAFRACSMVARIEETKFWVFEGVMTLTAAISYAFIFLRQKQMDHKMYQKIQRQIAAGV